MHYSLWKPRSLPAVLERRSSAIPRGRPIFGMNVRAYLALFAELAVSFLAIVGNVNHSQSGHRASACGMMEAVAGPDTVLDSNLLSPE